MGISASATLAYGIDLGDQSPYCHYDDETYEPTNPEFEDFDGDLGEFLALKLGHKSPWDSMPDGYSYGKRGEFPDFSKAVDKYRDIVSGLEREAPVKIEHYGMPVYDYSAYAVVLNSDASYRDVYDSGPIKGGLPVEPDADLVRRAIEFCAEHNFGDFSEADWLLLTNVG